MGNKTVYLVVILAIFTLFIVLEGIWSWKKQKNVFNTKETAANLFIFMGILALKPISFAYKAALFAWVSQFRLWTIPNNLGTLLLAIVFVDFLYYWMHRSYHEIALLWTIHNVHHSSPWMNLTTSFRLNWMGFLIAPFYFFPAILLGFSIESVLIFFLLNLLYQFFMHTEAIRRIPWIEGWLNTPSAHRVHHGSNPLYIDKNHGGILMIWDRIFGTYQEEVEPVKYGVTTGFMGHNPLKAIFAPLFHYIKGEFVREKHVVSRQTNDLQTTSSKTKKKEEKSPSKPLQKPQMVRS